MARPSSEPWRSAPRASSSSRILGGLTEGDQVITTGARALRDGDRIQLAGGETGRRGSGGRDAATGRRRPRAKVARETGRPPRVVPVKDLLPRRLTAHARTWLPVRRAGVKPVKRRAAASAAMVQGADRAVMHPAVGTATDDGLAATARRVRRTVSVRATAVRLSRKHVGHVLADVQRARPVDVPVFTQDNVRVVL